jgi:hypothetical protein
MEIYVDAIASDFGWLEDLNYMFSNGPGILSGISKMQIELHGTCVKVRGVSESSVFSIYPGKASVMNASYHTKSRAGFIKELHLRYFDTVEPRLVDMDWSDTFQGMSSLEELVVIGEAYVPDEIIAVFLPYRTSNGEVEIPRLNLSVLQILCPMTKDGPVPSFPKVIQRRNIVNGRSIQTLRLPSAYVGISTQAEIFQIQNNIGTMDIVIDQKYTSDTEFEEVLNMKYYPSGPESWW